MGDTNKGNDIIKGCSVCFWMVGGKPQFGTKNISQIDKTCVMTDGVKKYKVIMLIVPNVEIV